MFTLEPVEEPVPCWCERANICKPLTFLKPTFKTRFRVDLNKNLLVPMFVALEIWHSCVVVSGSRSGVTRLCWDKFEVKEGRPCRAEKRASSRLADNRCSWELQLGT